MVLWGKKKFNFTKARLEKVQVIEHLEGWDSGILKILPSASFISDPDGVANVPVSKQVRGLDSSKLPDI